MNFEIEIISNEAKSEVFDLKNFLLENDMQSFKVQLKEYAPSEGEMSIAISLATVVGEKILDITLEKCFGIILEEKIKAWLTKRNKTESSKIEVVTSVSSNNEKIHYVTNNEGSTKRINQNFTLNVHQTTAIIIGNGKFDNDFAEIKPISGNVEKIYKILSDKRIFGIPRSNIKILVDRSSTEIEEELLIESRKSGLETLIIYFAGHGYRADLKKLYLISKNSRKIGDHIIGGVDFDFIKNTVLHNATANNKIVLLDACHSGIAAQGESDSNLLEAVDVKGSYILASSSADKVSYFNSDHTSTYFTTEFVNLFQNGLSNGKEWLSIEDIFENLKLKLVEKKLPIPHSKSELTIPTSNFFLASNVRFDIKELIRQTETLFELGKLEEAQQIFNKLHLSHPENIEITNALNKCRNELLFNKYVDEGDKYFYSNNYNAAFKAYENALSIKNEYSVIVKIEKCKNLLVENVNKSGLTIGFQSKETSTNLQIGTNLVNESKESDHSITVTQSEKKEFEPVQHLSEKHLNLANNLTTEYPKKIEKKRINRAYWSCICVIIPLLNYILPFYLMITGHQWWKKKVLHNGALINEYDDTSQKHGKIIFIIGASYLAFLVLLLLLYFSQLK